MNLTDSLRSAIETVRRNPGAVEALEREEAERAKAAAAEAKRAADLAAKLEKATPDRVTYIVADFHAREEAAILAAATDLAKAQLTRELGMVPVAVIARSPVAPRLSARHVEAAATRLYGAAPIPWDRAGRSADQLRSDTTRDASLALAAAHPDTRALERDEALAAAETRRQEMEELARRRAAANAERKRLAGLPGYRAPAAEEAK